MDSDRFRHLDLGQEIDSPPAPQPKAKPVVPARPRVEPPVYRRQDVREAPAIIDVYDVYTTSDSSSAPPGRSDYTAWMRTHAGTQRSYASFMWDEREYGRCLV